MRHFLTLFSFMISVSVLFATDAQTKIIKVSAGDHFALGVAISDPGEETVKDLKLDGGAEIVDVFEDSEAERIGLDEKDIIIKFDGKTVKDAKQLSDRVDEMETPKTVKIMVNRDGKTKTFTANLKKVEKSEHRNITVDIDDDDINVAMDALDKLPRKLKFIKQFGENNKGGFLGVEAKNISEQMLDYFEVKNGVLIEAVTDDAPAQRAGLKAGDVITKINERNIEDFSDLVRTLNFYNPGEKVTVHYVRKGKSKSVKVELAKKEKMFRKGQRNGFLWHSDADGDHENLEIIKEKLHGKKMKLLKKKGKLLKDINIRIYVI